jgi:lysozyme
MRISTQGLELLIEREGSESQAYLDTAEPPVWTIGVGHTGPEVHDGLVWTAQQIKDALAHDVKRFEDAVNAAATVDISQHAFDALVSFAFNVGPEAVKASTLIRKINAGDLEGAAVQFDRWHIPPSITSRRNGEREQFRGTRFAARIPA